MITKNGMRFFGFFRKAAKPNEDIKVSESAFESSIT